MIAINWMLLLLVICFLMLPMGGCQAGKEKNRDKSDGIEGRREIGRNATLRDSTKKSPSALEMCMKTYYLLRENPNTILSDYGEIVRNPFGLSPFCLSTFFERHKFLLREATMREVLERYPRYDVNGRELDDSCTCKMIHIEHDKYTITLEECERKCYPEEASRLAEYLFQEPDTFVFMSMRLRDPRFYLVDSIHVDVGKGVLYRKFFPLCDTSFFEGVDTIIFSRMPHEARELLIVLGEGQVKEFVIRRTPGL